jgi:hypothetical protein
MDDDSILVLALAAGVVVVLLCSSLLVSPRRQQALDVERLYDAGVVTLGGEAGTGPREGWLDLGTFPIGGVAEPSRGRELLALGAVGLTGRERAVAIGGAS